MRKTYTLILSIPFLLAFVLLTDSTGFAQCPTSCVTTNLGTVSCNRSNFFAGEFVPNNGCGTDRLLTSYSPGEYFRMPVLRDACYRVSTCGAPIDTQIKCYQGNNTTSSFSRNDDNGPSCTGADASVEFVPNFTDYARIDIRQFNCSPGGSASITVRIRQNNNLLITSSSADMCAGQTRTLTSCPVPVASAQPNSGNLGTFSGTGVSGTTFTAPTPATASANYTISFAYGYCTRTQTIRVYRAPTTSAAGPDQTVCVGTASLSANNPTFGTGAWTVVTGPGSVTTPSSPTSGVTGLVAGTPTTFRWTITNGPCAASTDDVTITRDPEPSAPNAGSDQTVCATAVSLSGNTPAIGSGQWTRISGAGTIVSPNSPVTAVTGLGVGANVFRWTISNGVCTDKTDDVTITRDALPTAANAGPDQTVCTDATNLQGNAPAIGSGMWTVVSGAANVVAPTSPNSIVNGLTFGMATLAWTTSNGTCPSSTDTVRIWRNAPPGAPSVSGDLSVCIGNQASLTASSGATSPSFEWFNAATGGSSLSTNATYTTPPLVSNTTYWVEVTDSATGCTSNRTQITVQVNSLPNVSLGNDTTICESETICLNAGNGMAGYNWSTGAITQSICTSTPGVYWVRITDANGCTDTDTLVLTTNPAPTVSLGGDVTVCPGVNATFTAGTDSSYTYAWSNGANTMAITVSTPGIYSVTVTGGNGCATSDTVELANIAGTTANFSTDLFGCPNVVFNDQSLNATAWSWDFGQGSTSNLQNPTYNYQNDGNGAYTVRLIASGNCGSDTTTQLVQIGCIVAVEVPNEVSIFVYPNPNNGTFNVQFNGMQDDVHMRIFNTLGQQVYQRSIVDERGDYQEEVMLRQPTAGIYFVEVNVGGQKITKRVIVK